MKLIVGLGNIGSKYQKNRHNVGFVAVDALAAKLAPGKGFTKSSKLKAEVLDLKAEHGVILAKPTTMMNLSGEAVQALARYHKVEAGDIWVVYDEADLPFGQLRFRLGGSSAGHNGIKSLIQHVGHEFWRVRIGIANERLATTPSEHFVLDNFNSDEAKQLPELIDSTVGHLVHALENDGLAGETHSI